MENLLKSRRQVLHHRVAELLRAERPARPSRNCLRITSCGPASSKRLSNGGAKQDSVPLSARL